MNYILPNDVRSTEHMGINLQFQEVCIHGSDEGFCQVVTSETSDDVDISDTYKFSSWEDMLEQYPTAMELLKEISNNPMYESSWRWNDRVYFIESSVGHEGLYEISSTVWFDAKVDK